MNGLNHPNTRSPATPGLASSRNGAAAPARGGDRVPSGTARAIPAPPFSDLAELAIQEYERRRERLAMGLGQGRIDPATARHVQRCWLAIAILCGADPADAAAALENRRRQWPDDPRLARVLAADDCAPRAAWQAELLRASAVALSTDSPIARALHALRNHLGVTAPVPVLPAKPERKAA